MLRRRRALLGVIVVAVGAGLLVWDESRTSAPAAHGGWPARAGDAWKTYVTSYRAGWRDGCPEAVTLTIGRGQAPDGFSAGVCSPARDAYESPALPSAPPGDPANEGYELGLLDGCVEAFVLAEVWPGSGGMSEWDYRHSSRCRPVVRE